MTGRSSKFIPNNNEKLLKGGFGEIGGGDRIGYMGFFGLVFFCYCLVACCFVFLELHPRHVEVPRLGLELELQLLAFTTATAMLDLSRVVCDVTYTTAHGVAGSPTH